MPELRHLRYFVAVAEELNFSRAARRLRMAQPPLSVAIRQLEQEIGTSLFHRTSHEVKLTEAGAVLLEGARRTLAEAEGAVTAAQRAGAGQLGVLRVGYSWSERFETLPTLGRAMRRSRPDLELLTEEMRTYRMPAALRSGAIDAALAVLPHVVSELSYRVIRRERIVAVLSSSHPLAGEEELPLDALADDFVLFPRNLAPSLHDFYVGLCRRAGFEPADSRESSRSRWTMGTWNDSTASCPSPSRRTCRPGRSPSGSRDRMTCSTTSSSGDRRSEPDAGRVRRARRRRVRTPFSRALVS